MMQMHFLQGLLPKKSDFFKSHSRKPQDAKYGKNPPDQTVRKNPQYRMDGRLPQWIKSQISAADSLKTQKSRLVNPCPISESPMFSEEDSNLNK